MLRILSSFFVSNVGKRLPSITFNIKNEQVPFILDSGASCSIISAHLVPRETAIDKNDKIKIRGINGSTLSSGSINICLCYGQTVFGIKAYVVKGLPPSIPALLGKNFLYKYETILNFKEQTLIAYVNNCKIKIPFNTPNMSFICVPARTEITAFVEVNVNEPQVLLSEEVKPYVFIANSIVKPNNGKIPVKILNVSRKTVLLHELQPKMEKLDQYNIIQLDDVKTDSNRAEKLLKELKINHLSREEKATIRKICLKYNDIFCLSDDKLSVTKILSPSIAVKQNTQPVYTKPYRLPQSQKEEIAKQIKNMTDSGIIEEARSEWNSPVLLVPKKSCDDKKNGGW